MGVVIRQKTKGKGQPWWVFISYNGKRTSRKVGSKDAAKKVASKIEAKLKLGEFGFEQPKKRVPTFSFKGALASISGVWPSPNQTIDFSGITGPINS